MPGTTFRQKCLLILVSLFITFVLLEVALRVGGHVFNVWQRSSRPDGIGTDSFRILCIGESTTALGGDDSYPSQLKEILGRRSPQRRFAVINAGMVSKSSQDILEKLPAMLKKYQPQLVIAMLGVNDRHMLPAEDTWKVRGWLFLRRSKAYHFFELLIQHLYHKIKLWVWKFRHGPVQSAKLAGDEDLPDGEGDALPDIAKTMASSRALETRIEELSALLIVPPFNKDRDRQALLAQLKNRQGWLSTGIGRYYRLRGEYDLAAQFLFNALRNAPDNVSAYVELGRCYKDEGDCERAEVFFRQAFQRSPGSAIPLLELLRCYSALGDQQRAYLIARLLISQNDDVTRALPEAGRWLKQQGYLREAEQAFLKVLKVNPYDYSVYEELAEIYSAQQKPAEAEIYFLKAQHRESEMTDYLPATIANYMAIADLVRMNGARLICMQYPLRDIEPLKRIFPDEGDILFVENQENFTRALKNGGYTKYFSDFFGGDFGHCKRPGNRLIAENLAQVILSRILYEDK